MAKDLEQLLQSYEKRKDEIKKRLQEFKQVMADSEERIFAELAFCICTPQSKATVCWNSISSVKNKFLYVGTEKEIRPFLNPIRFADNKAKYIISARNFFSKNGRLKIKDKLIQFENSTQLREWLVENVMGFGMKEASHFMRNIGLFEDVAILDRHILKNLVEYGVIDEMPKTLTAKVYLEIEKKMKEFAEKIGIPFAELDLLFWSEETGHVFK